MPKSQRLGAILFALSSLLILQRPLPANGQGSQQAFTLFHVQGAAQTSAVGLTPAQIRRAYGFDKISNQGEGQVIAIVDAFDHPNIEDDLRIFDETFGLPACTTANGCFKKVPATNPTTPDDFTLSFWRLEIALDVEWAHAIAPKAKILLVEAAKSTLDSLMAAVDVAMKPQYKTSVVSMSWGGSEFATEAAAEDGHFVGNQVTFLAASGDSGTGTLYPAVSPFVMSVGGTSLQVDAAGNYLGEKAWSGSGGGLSSFEPEPLYQIAYPIPSDSKRLRGTPDVAYDGDPDSGVAVFNSSPYLGQVGWFQVGGTSAGPPQWAALFAIANSMRAAQGKSALTGSQGVLYDASKASPDNYNDIAQGSRAKAGYDYSTGLGTPIADNLVDALATAP
jgi:subtilase family serine protease